LLSRKDSAISKHDNVPFQAEQSSSIKFAIGIEQSETVKISRVEISALCPEMHSSEPSSK
jgi:hypothetical protein